MFSRLLPPLLPGFFPAGLLLPSFQCFPLIFSPWAGQGDRSCHWGAGRAGQGSRLPRKVASAGALHTEETCKGPVVCLPRGNGFAFVLGKKPSTPTGESGAGGQGESLQHPWGSWGCSACPESSHMPGPPKEHPVEPAQGLRCCTGQPHLEEVDGAVIVDVASQMLS